ncbi:RNB domain-containing ribonuclease [Solirubrobacter sp. CPCC 204708]|uniref:RNB domain-containing ribonuclease n=1 Tax=Solirubrobacter deserti TaxID=2282478 RepID=A0ABT4RRF6_9ACTN|nr:RNB domain-containing ribonuclease [Solirubrobacter deserti]MBE2319307.1 RNB domain-containing ribonuclease [Solirubrobacter deserti]MDA0141173.1 RNB domain-containing ribonuclease [Solirubrobacter deserti]
MTLVGVLSKHGKHYAVTPLFEPGPRIEVEKPRREGVGDLVEVGAAKGRRFRVVRRLGRPDVARDVLEGLMLQRGLRRRFDPLVERAAREAAPDESGRRDLRELPTFTIDPPTARDFDDAISAEELDDGAVRVWVHIADVAAFVPAGSPVDREAFRRGTSVYVPGLVEPMLPEALSNGACSLVPHQDRLAVTVELEFDGAAVRRTAFHRSIIRSDARLSYPEVDELFAAGEAGPQGLAAARRVARALADKRAARGALTVESSEPEFAFSREGHVRGVESSEATESHELIEFLMIAANEAVADLLEKRKLAGVFRVHEPPDPARVEHLLDQLTSLDLPVPPAPEHLTAKQAGELVEEAARRVHGPAYTSLILRSLKQARYSARNLGHFGLRSERYCHFTSPIRRYPDLICHRALLNALGFDEPTVRPHDLEPAAEWCSQRERDAMSIERAADNVARAFLLESELFQTSWQREFTGEVRGVIGAGAFVAFDGFEGLLPVRALRDDWWDLNEQETMLVARSGKRIRIGDEVTVQVEKIDAPRGRVDLLPVTL